MKKSMLKQKAIETDSSEDNDEEGKARIRTLATILSKSERQNLTKDEKKIWESKLAELHAHQHGTIIN
jgi:hypothetical protein